MLPAADTLRRARRDAGLTQAQAAHRLGTAQSAVAQLERTGSNPTVTTLRRALAATGHDLALTVKPLRSSVDETLIARKLRMSPAERIADFEQSYGGARHLAVAAGRSRGELA
jgi:transcriptional regulator with XRE-family HTH domain